MDREDGAAVAGSALSRRARILLVVALVAVVSLIATVAIALARPGPPPAPSPSAPVSSPPPAPTPVRPPAPAAATSDTFDGWGVERSAGSTRFLATESHHGGDAALLVVRPAGDTPLPEPSMTQTVTVAQDSRVVVSFWASSDGSPGDAPVQVRFGGTVPATVALPAGAYDWTRFSVAWTVPSGVTSAPLTITAAGETAGTRIDDVAVQGQGSRGVVVENAGFERSSAPISITNSSLVLQRAGSLQLASRLAAEGAFSWVAQEYTGGPRLRGHGRFADGAAAVPLAGFPTGYYTLTLSVRLATRTVERSTNLVVTTSLPATSTTPLLGVGVHLGALDSQLDQKIGDLAALGIRAARTDADWAAIERRQGEFDFGGLDPVVAGLEQAGLRPLLIPDYRNPLYDGGRTPSSAAGIAAYARFAAAVAARYPGADIDVYNEFDWRFNDGACGTTPQCYLALLRPTAVAVKAAGTSAAVAGPDISGIGVQQEWLQGFIAGGGLGLVDALDLHPYVQPDRPDVLADQLDTLRASMAGAGAGDLPIWFTEFGAATMPDWVTERQQAEDAARVFAVAAAHGVARVYWYDAIDDGPDRNDQEDNFGLFRTPDSLAPGTFIPKPAAAVYTTLARSMPAGPTATTERPGGDATVVRFPSGAALAWSPGRPVEVTVERGLRVTSMTGRPMAGLTRLGSSPVVLQGDGRVSAKSR